MYMAVDIHGTIVAPNYKAGDIPKEFYPGAKETLAALTADEETVLIMYTCSHPHEIEQYVQFFADHGIVFNYVNENPEVATDPNGYGCYDKKFYTNVILDDKAGFNPKTDWYLVKSAMYGMEPLFDLITTHICMTRVIGVHDNLFGGVMMSWLDEAAAAYVSMLIKSPDVVTLKVSETLFKRPVKVGNTIRIFGTVTKVGRTSVTVRLVAVSHHVETGLEETMCDTNMTFVRVWPAGNSREIDPAVADAIKKRYGIYE